MEKVKNDNSSENSSRNHNDGNEKGPEFGEFQGDGTWEVSNTLPTQPKPKKGS